VFQRPFSPRRSWKALCLLGCGATIPAIAQTINVPGGLPQSVHAVYPEIGLGDWSPPASTTQQTINGSGTVTATTSTSSLSASDPLQTLYGQSWGYAAAENASTLGVNPEALAATCVVESGCQNLYTATGSSTITGAFQMSNGTYTEAMQQALAADPGLASTITEGTAGQQDPATQAVAAAQYLKDAATTLEDYGVSNPTAVDTRAYYNFGPSVAEQMAQATDDSQMSSYISSSTMANNGITPGETVGQWKSAVAAKMGSGAYASVLSG